MLVMTATAFAETTSEKLVEDNYALAGKVLSPKAVTVDWATQKLVVVLDMTTCSDTENERVFSVSNNETDVANWEQTNGGSTVHLFYTKDAKVWTGTAMENYHQKFAVQYRYQGDAGATSYYKEVTDPSTVTVVMDKTGISIDGDLVFPAAEMSNLYGEGDNQLYFGAGCGTPGYATYKSVELVTEKAEPFSPVTLSTTDVANAVYNGTTTNYDAKTVDFVQYEEGKYKLVWKTLEAGSTILGDYTIDNITVAEDAETHVLTLTTTDTEGTWSNVNPAYGTMLDLLKALRPRSQVSRAHASSTRLRMLLRNSSSSLTSASWVMRLTWYSVRKLQKQASTLQQWQRVQQHSSRLMVLSCLSSRRV